MSGQATRRAVVTILLAALSVGAGCGDDDSPLSEECERLGEEMAEALDTASQEGSSEADQEVFLEADTRFREAGCREELELGEGG